MNADGALASRSGEHQALGADFGTIPAVCRGEALCTKPYIYVVRLSVVSNML